MGRSFAQRSLLLLLVAVSFVLAGATTASASFGYVNGLNMFGGGAAGDLTQWSFPVGLARAADGSLFVLDQNTHRVVKLDSDGHFLLEWGAFGTGDGQLSFPTGIGINPIDNQVYVVDNSNHRVQVFDQSGGFLRKWGSSGSGDDKFSYPQGIAFDATGNVFVTDANNHRVVYFNSAGGFLGKIADASAPGQLAFPKGIAIGSDGRIFVVDRGYLAPSNHGRVVVYASIGDADPHHYLGAIGSWGDNPGQFIDPMGVTIRPGSPLDEIYVTNVHNAHRIQRFTTDLTAPTPLLGRWGYDNGFGDGGLGYGSEPGKFNGPTQIIVDSSNNAWVTDGGNQRIQIFSGANGIDDQGATFVRSFGTNGSAPGQFRGPISVAAAPDGSAYVAEYDGAGNSRIQHVTAKGAVIASFSQNGSADGDILDANGMSVGPDGDLWVADSSNHRVQRFSAAGVYESKITSVAGTNLSSPSDVVVAPDGTIYIADFGNRRVAVVSADGLTESAWGTMGTVDDAAQFQGMTGIALSPDAAHVYVLDNWANNVKKFSTAGAFEAKSGPYSGSGGTGDGQFKSPYGIDVDPTTGEVLVADQSNDRFQRLSANLAFVSKIGVHGRDFGQFQTPFGISVDPHGYVWVPDRQNDRVQRFGDAPQVQLTQPAAGTTVAAGSALAIRYSVTDAGANCDTADGASTGPIAAGQRTITVTCSNSRGSGSASVTVNATAPQVNSPATPVFELTLAKKLKLATKLKFSVRCTVGCTVGAKLVAGKKSYKLKSVTVPAQQTSARISMRIQKGTVFALKNALKDRKKVTFAVTVTPPAAYKATQGKTGKAKLAK